MTRRAVLFIASLVIVLCLSVSSAMAWSGGGLGPTNYGTHHWILEHAIVLAGSPAWIDVTTALHHVNDPDYAYNYPNDTSVDPQNTWWHLFEATGQARGGPQAVTDYYYKIHLALAAGDNETASKQLGIMSHYYDDPIQPFHTMPNESLKTAAEHGHYESEVSVYTHRYPAGTDWIHPSVPTTITDIRTSAINASLFARTKYTKLRDTYSQGNVKSNAWVNATTGDLLSRAINDLADIIRSIPNTSAISQPPAKMITTISHQYTGCSHVLKVSAKCVDAKGNKLEGIPVDFWWPTKTGGTTKQTRYSQSDGVASSWYTVPKGIPLMKKWTVKLQASSVGTQTTSSSWFMVTPHLANGAAGIKTTVSTHHPAQNSVLSARTVVHASNGKPVAGLNCTFTWTFKSHTYAFKTVTDANGVARSSRNIGTAEKGYRVHVRAQVISDAHHRSSTASFVPR